MVLKDILFQRKELNYLSVKMTYCIKNKSGRIMRGWKKAKITWKSKKEAERFIRVNAMNPGSSKAVKC